MSGVPRYRVAQLSDIHLSPLPHVPVRSLLSKRVLGYLSWSLKRHELHRRETLRALQADLAEQRVDHIVVTGDLVNIGLPQEYELARAWLGELGPPSRVSIIPGNHDAYVAGSLRAGWASWRDYMGDADAEQGFPWMRSLGDLVLLGLSSAVPTGWGIASGHLGATQLTALAELLVATPRRKARVILVHHQPIEGWSKPRKCLTDAFLLRAILQRYGAELVLCGHEHRLSIGSIPGPRGPIPVIGAPSASIDDRPGHAAGGYLIHSFTQFPDGWRIATERRGLLATGEIVVEPVR